jgi:hypothetical protein
MTLALAGCLYPDLSEFERCSAGACGTGANAQGGAGPNTNVSATTTGTGPATATTTGSGGGGNGPTGPCDLGPNQSGSPGIENPGAPGRCIDVREATFDEYEAFRVAMTPEVYATLPIDPALCDFKLTDGEDFRPLEYIWNEYDNAPSMYGARPVLGLDWCSAYLYCKAAGKSLCGTVNGAPVAMSGPDWADETEMAEACIADAQSDPTSGCSSTQGCAQNPLYCSVPADTGCVGSAGLHHMLSNAVEFEDNCTRIDTGPYEDDPCRTRGLNYADDGAGGAALAQTCKWPSPSNALRGDRQDQGGVRCCWDAK